MNPLVLVLLAEGFEEMEAVISIDILRRAGLEVKTAAVGEDILVRGSRGISIRADMFLKDFSLFPEALVLPGGLPGADNLADSEQVIGLLKECARREKLVAAICAAPARVLAPAGLLDGKRATGYPGTEIEFSSKTEYTAEAVSVDGKIITASGPGTAFEFALAIAAALAGPEKARSVRQKALVDKPLNQG